MKFAAGQMTTVELQNPPYGLTPRPLNCAVRNARNAGVMVVTSPAPGALVEATESGTKEEEE